VIGTYRSKDLSDVVVDMMMMMMMMMMLRILTVEYRVLSVLRADRAEQDQRT